MVGVAQLVEPQIVDLVVVGSSPIVHPTPHSHEPWDRGHPALKRGTEGCQPSPRAKLPRSPRLQAMAILHPRPVDASYRTQRAVSSTR